MNGIGRATEVLFAILVVTTGCAPTFSDLQSARLVGPGRLEVTPSYSYVQVAADGEREKLQQNFGVQLATGVSERVDARARYEIVKIGAKYVSIVGAGPKLGFGSDRAALYTPIGFAFGSEIEASKTFQIQPTLLLTFPVNRNVEVNAGGKALVWFDRSNEDLLAFNLGLGLSQDLEEWAFRPEAGVMVNPGESGSFWHFSVGFTRFVGLGGSGR